MRNNHSNHAPAGACEFIRPVEKFADDDADNGRFRIIAYSGEVIPDHWYWGNVAFDLKGQKFAKAKTPILSEHDHNMRIGFTTRQEIGERIVVEGTYLSNAEAAQMKSDIAQGFPMQASVYNPPEVIEDVPAGASVEVNGHTLNGPGTVFRRATIQEVSFAVVGYDTNTRAMAMAEDDKQEIQFEVVNTKEYEMSEKDKQIKELTLDRFSAEHSDLYSQITTAAKAAGGKEADEKFAAFCEKFGDCPAFVIEQFGKGVSITEATDAFAQKMKGERDAAIASAEEAKKSANTAAAVDDPAHQEFSDLQSKKGAEADGLEGDEKYAAEFKADKQVRFEFRNKLDDYKAFRRNEEKGLIKVKTA